MSEFVKGTFTVDFEAQPDKHAPVGRMIINKKYAGGMEGIGIGQMISKRTETGIAVYYAIEEFTGSVDGKEGAFTLVHYGYMSPESQSLEVKILESTGAADLKNISGSLKIMQESGIHNYELNYNL